MRQVAVRLCQSQWQHTANQSTNAETEAWTSASHVQQQHCGARAAAMQELKHGHSKTKAQVGSSSEYHANLRFTTMQYHDYMICITTQYHVNMILQLGPNLHHPLPPKWPEPKHGPKPTTSGPVWGVFCARVARTRKRPPNQQNQACLGVFCARVARARKRPTNQQNQGLFGGCFVPGWPEPEKGPQTNKIRACLGGVLWGAGFSCNLKPRE